MESKSAIKLTDAIGSYHSHTIVSEDGVKSVLSAGGLVIVKETKLKSSKTLTAKTPAGVVFDVVLSHRREFMRQMDSDPRGGTLNDPAGDWYGKAVYVLSGTLCRALLGDEPGASFMGRGFAHSANMEALVKAGW